MTRKPKPEAKLDPSGARRAMVKLLQQNADRHQLWTVWSDFVEMAALAYSNAVDLAQRAPREARYLEIVKRYTSEQAARFGQALGALVMALEHEPGDVLGTAFMELELGSDRAGQFFTPFPLCRLMAAMLVDDGLAAQVAARGFVTAADPAVGGGAMPIALAIEMQAAGYNFQTQLHVTAQDIDERAAHMAYVQLAALHVPAIVAVGDTLRMETRAVWYTPAHVWGGWSRKLRGGRDVLAELPELVAAAIKLEAPAPALVGERWPADARAPW